MKVAPVLLGAVLLLGGTAPAASPAADDPAEHRVVVMRDSRIPESSALAVSTRAPGLVYTVNDSGNSPVVYAVSLRSGDVVGTAVLADVQTVDPEALAIGHDDRLYVADIGDNDSVRDTVELYAIEQPGRGEVTVTPQTYVVRYADGPHDSEALVAEPVDGALTILTKDLFVGTVYQLPTRLDSDRVVTARPLAGARLPGLVTDATALGDDRVAVRTYSQVVVYRLPGWHQEASAALPPQRQGESLAVSAEGDHLLAGTEGIPSPVLEVPIPVAPRGPRPSAGTPEPTGPSDDAGTPPPAWPAWAVGAATVVLGGAWLMVRRGQRRRSTT